MSPEFDLTEMLLCLKIDLPWSNALSSCRFQILLFVLEFRFQFPPFSNFVGKVCRCRMNGRPFRNNFMQFLDCCVNKD